MRERTAGGPVADSLPLIGKVWLKYQVGLFSRTLSTLLKGGFRWCRAWRRRRGRSTASRSAMRCLQAWRRCAKARDWRRAWTRRRCFPNCRSEMIEVGESTGALPQMLNSVAEFFEEDVQTKLTAAMALIEPAILIVMGVVVVTILIALYLPIFSMGNSTNLEGSHDRPRE